MADIKSALTINTSQFQSAISSSTSAVTNLGTKIVSAGQQGTEAFTKLAAAAESVTSKMNSVGGAIVGAGLISFAHAAAESVSQMVDLANSVGVSTQAMMEMNLAAVAAGTSGEAVAKMIQKMNIAALDAANGNTKLQSEMEALGVSQDYLRTHSSEDTFKRMAAELGNMTDVSKRATLSMDIFGKSGSRQVWNDLSEGMTKYAGTQKESAAATESAKKVMDELAVGAENVKNQFVLLLAPVTDFIAPMVDGLGGAKVAAVALAGAMGLFAGASIIGAIDTVIGGVSKLAGSMSVTTAATTASTAALVANAKAVDTFMAGAYGRLGTATMGVSVARAELNAVEATGTVTAEALHAAKQKLILAEGKLAIMTAASAETRVASNIATGASVAVNTAAAAAEGVATFSAAGLSAAMKGLAVSTAAALIPLTVIAVTIGAVAAAAQAVYNTVNGKGGKNFLNDYIEETLGIDSKTLTEKSDNIARIASLSAEQKAAYDKMNDADKKALLDAMKTNEEAKKAADIQSVLSPTKKTVVDTSALDAIKAQGDSQRLNNDLAKEKLQLDISSLNITQDAAQAAVTRLEAESAIRQNNLKAQQDIQKLEEQAKNLEGTDDKKAAQLREQTAQIKTQLELNNAQVLALEEQKNAVNAAKNAEKDRIVVQELGLKITQEEADLRREISLVGATNEQKALADIQKRIDAEVQGQIKIAMAKNGNKPIGAEAEAAIKATVTPKYEEEKQLAVSLQKANDAEAIRLAYMSTEQKIATDIRSLQRDADELTMTNDQIKLNGINRRIDAEVEGIVRIREAQQGGKSLGQSEIDDIRAKLTPKFEEEKAATQALIDKSREFSTGWDKAWNEYADNATNAANQAKEVFSAMTTAAESAFDKLIGDSDATWSQIFNSALKQMMKSDFKNALGSLMKSAGGSGDSGGGIFSSVGKMFAGGFATGGYIPAGSYGITGENGPETVNGPATITPAASAGSTTHIYINAMDTKGVYAALAPYADLIHGLNLKGQRAAGG